MASRGENRIILEGTTIGRLAILRPKRKRGQILKYECRCACGSTVIVGGQNLRRGLTQSCGCLQRERSSAASLRHGKSRTKIHNIWSSMIQRCRDVNCASYPDYGGRGIAVCERWLVFENFYADMGDPPEGLTLDREDNDLGYSKENCCWSTKITQANNRRSSKMITFGGETKTQAEWERVRGLKVGVLWQRLNRGWTVARALGF